jgi:WD40 repeat protein
VEISRDEEQVIATSQLGMVQVWRRNNSEPLATVKASEKFIHCAAFSPDGKQILVCDEAGDLSVWEKQKTSGTQVVETTKRDKE